MPYSTRPDEEIARPILEKFIADAYAQSKGKGAAPISIGQATLCFHELNTRTSFEVNWGWYRVLRGTIRRVGSARVAIIGKTFLRGDWEQFFGVQRHVYDPYVSDDLPARLVEDVREGVNSAYWSKKADVLEDLKSALGAWGDFVEDFVNRTDGAASMVDIVCSNVRPSFLVLMALVLWKCGARCEEIRAILKIAEDSGGDVGDILLTILDEADCVEEFQNFLRLPPRGEQVTLMNNAILAWPDRIPWYRNFVADDRRVIEFVEALTTVFDRSGLELKPIHCAGYGSFEDYYS